MIRSEDIEAAVCESEIAGSGHLGDEEYDDQDRIVRACEWHRAEYNAKVRRFIDALQDRIEA